MLIRQKISCKRRLPAAARISRCSNREPTWWPGSPRSCATIFCRNAGARAIDWPTLSMTMPTPWLSPVVNLRRSKRNELRIALDRLPVQERPALVLVLAAGFSYEEVAEAARCPVDTVKSRVSRARRKISILLAADDAGANAERCHDAAAGSWQTKPGHNQTAVAGIAHGCGEFPLPTFAATR